MTDNLLPCPFCGGPAANIAGKYITCGAGWNDTCVGHQLRAEIDYNWDDGRKYNDWNARPTPKQSLTVDYAEAVEKVSIAIIQRDIKGCGGEIMDRGKELAKAALAALGIVEGK